MLLRCVAALVVSGGIVACSPTMDGDLDATSQSFSAATPPLAPENAGSEATGDQTGTVAGNEAGAEQQLAAVTPVPQARPETAGQDSATAAAQAETSQDAPPKPDAVAGDAAAPAQAPSQQAAENEAPASAEPAQPKQQGFLASFFGAGKQQAKPAATKTAFAAPEPSSSLATNARQASKPLNADAKQFLENTPPQLSFENIAPVGEKSTRAARRGEPPQIRTASASAFADDGEGTGLPGVRQSALFEIKRKSGIDDDSDVDIHEDVDDGTIDVATAAGLARLAPNGLLKQRDSVDVGCLKPSLVRVLKTIERHFGRKVIVTSGYRSPTYNRRVRGAKNSQHMYCAAADIQVPGISRWELANFARAMPGRGGVGTYCHTASVHVDVGPERDWNWRCRGRRRT